MADPFFNELPFLKKHLVQCNQNKQKEDKTSKKILTVEPRSPDFPGEPAAPTSPCKKKKQKKINQDEFKENGFLFLVKLPQYINLHHFRAMTRR